MLITGLAHINQEGLDEIKTIGFKIDRKTGGKGGWGNSDRVPDGEEICAQTSGS